MDYNSKLLGTKSSKVRRIVPIKNYIINAIDKDQTIKRLSRYYTKTPLLNRGETYDGSVIKQPDLNDTLTKPIDKDTSVSSTARKRILFNYMFSGDVMAERQISIYVHSPKSVFNPNMISGRTSYGIDKVVGKHFFDINIAYPLDFNELDSVNQERANEIACRIIDLLDGSTIDGDFVEYTGDCQINIAGEITDLRLAVSDYMIMTIPFYVTVIGGRVGEDGLGGDTHYA